MDRRFSGQAHIRYHDVSVSAVAIEQAETISVIKQQGLIYPVTLIDGQPVGDRTISYPLIMRAVQSRLPGPSA